MQKVAVIGLGRFGMELGKQLAASGVEVIAIDRSQALINEIKDDVTVAVKLDSTDEAALRSQDVHKVDVCVIAVGENFEAALLTTVIVLQLGIPRIICRAQTQFHADIFRKIGATDVIQPETQAGRLLARKLANPQINDFISLADGYTLIELRAPKPFQGKTVKELELRQQYNVNLVVIKQLVIDSPDAETAATNDRVSASKDVNELAQQATVSVPKAETIIQPEDILVLVGPDESLAKLPKE